VTCWHASRNCFHYHETMTPPGSPIAAIRNYMKLTQTWINLQEGSSHTDPTPPLAVLLHPCGKHVAFWNTLVTGTIWKSTCCGLILWRSPLCRIVSAVCGLRAMKSLYSLNFCQITGIQLNLAHTCRSCCLHAPPFWMHAFIQNTHSNADVHK